MVWDRVGMRRWLLSILAALSVAALIVGAMHQWSQRSHHQGRMAAVGRGLEPREINLLNDTRFVVKPMNRTPTPDEATQAADSALGNFGFTSRDQIESIAYAEVTSRSRKLDSVPMLVVYLRGVPMNPVQEDPGDRAGKGDDAGSDLVVLVDPETMQFTWATQG
jgi:hypothetical protein